MPSLPIYHLKQIQQYYGNSLALNIDELKIEKGSITGLSGPNGSGKSTLLKLLAFVSKPTTGKILYNGRKEKPFSSAIRSKVTLLTQKPYLLKRTVFENIAYGLKIRKDKKNLEQRVSDALGSVGLEYQYFSNRMWHELSGGEAQRVAMAARLILKPEILLLDEPVASVDKKSARLIQRASLKARDDWGTTLIIASHDLQWLYSVSDTQLSIHSGTLYSTGVENIISGPFIKTSKSQWTKKAGNQTIVLPAPSKNKNMALIRKSKLCIESLSTKKRQDYNQLTGIILSMILEKKTGLIMVKIEINTMDFILSLTPDQISHFNLYPGKQVSLAFKPEDVRWA